MFDNFDIDSIKFENIHRKHLEIFRKSKKYSNNKFSLFQVKSALIDLFHSSPSDGAP